MNKEQIPMPKGIIIYNSSKTPCDMLKGSCCCGATHDGWIDITIPPPKTGWYKIKTRNNVITEACCSKTLSGKLVWVVPDEKQITHWTFINPE